MFTLEIKSSFSAAHYLRNYTGKCANLHGHNWRIKVQVSKKELNEIGMVMDFNDLKSALKLVTEELDHTDVNKHPYFKSINTTCENIAKFIYDKLSINLKSVPSDVMLSSVQVEENDGSICIYTDENL